MSKCRKFVSVLVVVNLVGAAAGLSGCDTLARSQGKYPVVSAFGGQAIDNSTAFVFPDGKAALDASGQQLIKIGYRDPFTGKLADLGKNSTASQQSYYMIVDMTRAIENPRLGAGSDDELYRQRLAALADLLFVAADWNGDVYWRHLTTFLETYDSANKAAQAALGAAIAGTFISPVLGASLAGAALATDTFVSDYTGQIDVESYAVLRSATSLTRAKLRSEATRKINEGDLSANALSDILVIAYDYAFTYSIRGALAAAEEQKVQLEQLLITGDSTWKPFFDGANLRYLKSQVDRGIIEGKEAERITTKWDAQEKAREESESFTRKIAHEQQKKQFANAEKERILAEQERDELLKKNAPEPKTEPPKDPPAGTGG